MKFEKRHIDSLTLDPDNLRVHPQRNIEAIKASLRKFGQQKPVVVTPGGVVVAGNGTVLGARELDWTEVWCCVTELERKEQVEYAMADNRSQELSEWNYTALTATFKEMLETEEWSLDDTRDLGWEVHEIEPLLNAEWSVDEEEEEYDDYDDPDDQHPARTEYRNLVRAVVELVRKQEGDVGLDEKDALKIVYLAYIKEWE